MSLTADEERRDHESDVTSSLNFVVGRGDPWRFVVLGVYMLHSMTNAMQWISYSPIVDEVKTFFNVDANTVDLLSSIYMFSYVAFAFLSCKVYEKLGLKQGLCIAVILNAIGASVKLIALYALPNVALLVISQLFNSITQVLLIATPPLVAADWFLSHERTVANALLSGSLNLGVAAGMLVPTIFVGPGSAGISAFGGLFWLEAALCYAAVFGTIVLMPRRPRDPPSISTVARWKASATFFSSATPSDLVEEDEDLPGRVRRPSIFTRNPVAHLLSTVVDSFLIAKNSPAFLFLNIASGVNLGIVWAIATVLPQIFKPFGISESQSGMMGFLNLLVGAIVAPFVGVYVEKHKNFKTVIVFCVLGLVVAVSALAISLSFVEDNTVIVRLAFALWTVAGVCQNILLPLSFEFCVEVTFPEPESTTAPTLIWNASWLALVFIAVYGAILGSNPGRHEGVIVLVVTAALSMFAGFMFLMIPSRLLRSEYEANKNQNPVAE